MTYQDLLAQRLTAEPTYVSIQGSSNVSQELAAVLRMPDGIMTIQNTDRTQLTLRQVSCLYVGYSS
ncbi:hypothetical protein EON65_16355 [archaeon]|nr:MAG: hypothetical protein EON65_16355 [archaeon]